MIRCLVADFWTFGVFMKKWIVASIIVAALLIILPFGMGVLAERNIDQRYAHLNRIMEHSAHIEIQNYRRGWFSSTAKLKVEVKSPKLSSALAKYLAPMLSEQYQQSAPEKFPLIVDLVIHHGPIIWQNYNPHLAKAQFGLGLIDATLDLPWNPQGQRWVDATIGKKKWLNSSSLIHYSGNFSNTFFVPQVHYLDTQNDIQVDWAGINLSTQMSRDINKVAFNLELSPIRVSHIKKGDTYIDSSAMKVAGVSQQGASGLWFGQFNFKMDNFVLTENAKPIISIAGITAVQIATDESSNVNTSLSYQVNKIDAYGKNYGPSALSMKLNGLGAKEFKSISDTLHGVDFDNMPEEQLAFFSLQLLPELLHMLNGSSLDIVFSTKAPEGDVDFKLNITTSKQDSGIVDPIILATNTRGLCSFSLPKSVLKTMLANEAKIAINAEITRIAEEREEQPDLTQVPQLAELAAEEHLTSLHQEGWISATDTAYKSTIEYKEGKIFSNGKVMIDVLEKIQPNHPPHITAQK
jgi:uncharacterized protein YdgA (DUF945 family)